MLAHTGGPLREVKRPDHALKFYDCALALPLSDADRLRVSGSRRLAEAEASRLARVDSGQVAQAPETVADEIPPDFSAGSDLIRKEVERFGGIPNDTPASLAVIDGWLELIETNGQPLKSESELRFSQREWSVGCYLGELLVKSSAVPGKRTTMSKKKARSSGLTVWNSCRSPATRKAEQERRRPSSSSSRSRGGASPAGEGARSA